MNIDFLIIGQGLAGSILSYSLLKEGKKVIVIDKGLDKGASKAAAGIFNPITGRQMRKTWMASELFNFLPAFYRELEQELGEHFFYELPVIRMFDSQKQINDWHGQLEKPGIKEFIREKTGEKPENIKAPLGLYMTKKSGFVDVPLFINSFRTYLKNKDLIIEEAFDFDKLKVHEKGLEYGNIKAEKIIFCEGYAAINNPFFNYLPIIPNKGEILEVEIDELSDRFIYNKNGFLMPRKANDFWVGATYHRNHTEEQLSEEGEKQLRSKIEGITDQKYILKKAHVGIRPTVKDRRPLIGLHPDFEQIGIFNGLGSKGVSIGPYWASEFIAYILHNKKLSDEVNISRFNSLN